MADLLLWANLAVAAGTLALAASTFQQSWRLGRERKAARARETIDNLLGPLIPFARRFGDKFWIYRGLSMEQWEQAARLHPHMVARLPAGLVADLHFLTDGTQLMQNLRNHFSSGYFRVAPEIAKRHLHPKDSSRNDIMIRLIIGGRVENAQIEPIELFLLGTSVEPWAAKEAKRLGGEAWELEPLWGGFSAGTSAQAIAYLRDVDEWLKTNPSARALAEHFEKLAAAGASARDQFDTELARLSKIERRG